MAIDIIACLTGIYHMIIFFFLAFQDIFSHTTVRVSWDEKSNLGSNYKIS